ncbi:phage tail protein [Serratia ureilytica]|uniref:glycine-rich domain-containing protein n=1 Tax=Serratia ureilytica TaxID=300181 RepID=UPI0018D85BED|nr:phage tail protein [Serratia marcescens]
MRKVGSTTDTADANGEYTNGNVAQGIPPTIINAEMLNTFQRELVNIVEGAGISLDPSNDSQVLEAVRKLLSPGRLLNVKTFTTSGTYTPTPGTKSIIVEGVGGGGGSGGSFKTQTGYYTGTGGGGAGGYFKTRLTSLPNSVTISIGKGGKGGIGGASPTAGENGGQTSFGTFAQASGGNGSSPSQPAVNSGVAYQLGSGFGGFATGGNILNSRGGDGSASLIVRNGSGVSGAGGASHFDVGGSSQPWSNSGNAGGVGSGGGGSIHQDGNAVQPDGGDGGDGIIVVYEYA